jgi:CRP-like cAMP-binding protein
MASGLIAAFERNATVAIASAGTILFRRGEPVSAVYLIRSGRLALEWLAGESVFQLHFAGPGEIVGLPAVLNGVYSLSARAAEETELGFVPYQWVLELIGHDARLSLEATRLVAREIARMRAAALNIGVNGNAMALSKPADK